MSKVLKCTKKLFYFTKKQFKIFSRIIIYAFSVIQGKCESKNVTLALNQRVGKLVFI